MAQLTIKQARCLKAFAQRMGHQWKSRLRNTWCRDQPWGTTEAAREEHALLRQIRNDLGPNWLNKVKMDEIQRAAQPGLEDHGKAKLDAQEGRLYCGEIRSLRMAHGLVVSIEDHGSILIKPGQLDDLVSLLCLAKEHGHVQ